MKLWKIVLYAAVIAAFASCSSYKLVTQSDTIYLEEGQDATSIFTSYNADIIRLEFKPIKPRLYYYQPYSSYWHTRPLWLDYNFIYDPWVFGYNSFFYRPWNYWDWYMRPWRPINNWTQGPFNNQGYNIVYNSSRRTSRSIETDIISHRKKPRIKPNIVIPRIKPKPNYSKPSYTPTYKPNYKPNNNSRPTYNSRPNNNSRPSYSPSMSKPSNNNISRGNGSTTNKRGN